MESEANKKKVLIVEDEAILLQAMMDAFGAEGFTALGATDGQQGLMVAREQRPDIILLDIIMPKMGGIAMLKELRSDPWGEAVPVIILTNLSDYKSVADALDEGVHNFLVKSDWEISNVIAAVKKKLNIS
jgi:DNA-binding response OmpR family regulator